MPYNRKKKILLEEALLVLFAFIVAVDNLQKEAGQCDEFAVWSRIKPFQKAVTSFIKQDEDGQWILNLDI